VNKTEDSTGVGSWEVKTEDSTGIGVRGYKQRNQTELGGKNLGNRQSWNVKAKVVNGFIVKIYNISIINEQFHKNNTP
jgi:hypothetical protein